MVERVSTGFLGTQVDLQPMASQMLRGRRTPSRRVTAAVCSASVRGRRQSRLVDAPVSGRLRHPFRRGTTAVRDATSPSAARSARRSASSIDGSAVVDLAGGWTDAAARPRGAPTHSSTSTRSGRHSSLCWRCELVDAGTHRARRHHHHGLARVRSGGQGGGDAAPGAVPPRRCTCHPAPSHQRDLWAWERMTGALAATEPWWEPGTRARVPHQHLRPPDRRGGAPGERGAVRSAVGRRWRARSTPTCTSACLPRTPTLRRRPLPCAGARHRAGRHAHGDALHGDAELLQPAGILVHRGGQHAGLARAEVPSTNGHGSACGVARLYGALFETNRLLSPRPPRRGDVSAVAGFLPHPA